MMIMSVAGRDSLQVQPGEFLPPAFSYVEQQIFRLKLK